MSSAANVVTLNATVPASWIVVAHQSIRRPSIATKRVLRGASGTMLGAVLMHSTYCRYAAVVKKIEPMKYVIASAFEPTRSA